MTETICPRCKTPNRNTAKFCSVCGQPFLDGIGEAPPPQPEPARLKPDTVLQSRYHVEKELGRGGFGAVYRAWDLNLNRPCAVKENLETSPEAQRQFFREASVLANLSHPNLPRVTDHFAIPDQGQYLVMDFIDGHDLNDLMEGNEPVPVEKGVGWILQVAEALEYMHNSPTPVLHRDIKPANIRVTPAGKAVLVDFGLVKMYTAHLKTTIGARAVTPGYAPPEQYGTGATDVRTDVYALGATAYRILTGEEPAESVQRLAGKSNRPAHLVNPQISLELSQVIDKAMALEPEKRFASMTEFIAALRSAPKVAPAPVVQPQPARSSEIPRTVVVDMDVVPSSVPVVSDAPRASSRSVSMPVEERTHGGSKKLFLGLGVGVIVVICLLGVFGLGAGYLFMQSQDQANQEETDTAREETSVALANEQATEAAEVEAELTLSAEQPTSTPPPTSTPKPTSQAATKAPASPVPPTATAGNPLGDPDASQSGAEFFSTEFDQAENWHLLSKPDTDSDQYEAYTDNGVLYMEIQPKGVTLYAFYDLVLNNPDVVIETYAQKVAGPNTNNISLVCRGSDTSWYEFSMSSGGFWFIWLYDNKYTLLTKGGSTAINLQGEANQIKASCIGNELTFYANGTKMGSVTDRTLRSGGKVGVSIYAEFTGLGVEFEWFWATVP